MESKDEYGMMAAVMASAALRRLAKRHPVQTSTIDPADVPPAVTESRQVRRARERHEAKTGRTVEAALTTIQQRAQVEMYDAPRMHDGSPPPHRSAHPGRYPKHHDPAKGQVYGGECNVTRCDNLHAVYWNMGTYGLYCPQCARGINWQPHKSPLCVLVNAKPELDDMEQFKRDHDYYGAL
jgi:hypothetical protein